MLISGKNAPQNLMINLNLVTFGALQIFLYTLIPILVVQTKLELSQIIIAYSVGTLCFIPGAMFWTKFADKGRAHFALSMNVLFLFLSVLLMTLHFYVEWNPGMTFVVFLLGRMVWGLGASGIPGLSQYLRLREEGKQVKNIMGNSLSLNIGRSLGPCLAFLPVETSALLFVLTIMVFLLALINACFILTETENADKNKASASLDLSGMASVFLLALTLTGITGFIHTGLAYFIKAKFQYPAEEASAFMGKLLFAGSLVMIISLYAGKKIVDQNWRGLILTGSIALVSGLILFPVAPSPEFLFVNVAMICMGISLLNPGIIILLDRLSADKSKRGQRLGQLNAMNTLGFAIGGLILSMTSGHFEIVCVIFAVLFLFISFKTLYPAGSKEVLWKH